jgi:2-hydroxychromene-2-carboxylate isomerase
MVDGSLSTWTVVRYALFLYHNTRYSLTSWPVSPYSWFGFTNTVRFRDLLNAHDVSVEIIPFFLGAARDSAGNPFKPPLKAKETFEAHDTEVTGKLLGLKVVRPELIPISSLFVGPLDAIQSLSP